MLFHWFSYFGSHHTDCTLIRVIVSELVLKYIREGFRMVKELFFMASIGVARMKSGSRNGDSDVQRTMLELINLLVLMATNCIDILDQALCRPRRINRKIEFPNQNEDAIDAKDMHKGIHTYLFMIIMMYVRYRFSR